MKTAISIPDDVFRSAERYARKLGLSRSELFTQAVRRFIEQHQEREIRASYDRAFSADTADDSADLVQAAAKKALADVEW